MSYGFTDIYGIKWDDPQVDLYNKVSEEIRQKEINGFEVSEQVLDERHTIYQVPLYNKKKGEIDDNKCRRREIFVSFKNGNSLHTAINGTKEEVRNYYLNNQFNMSASGKEEALTIGKSVIFLS